MPKKGGISTVYVENKSNRQLEGVAEISNADSGRRLNIMMERPQEGPEAGRALRC
jgi:hypothetical protein